MSPGPRFARLIPLAVSALFLVTGGLFAQESDHGAPAWLLLEQGKRAYDDRDFGTALALFRGSIAAGGDTPEAEMWIGKVFEEEGEVTLAIDQYDRALRLRKQFTVPDEALAVEYDIARLCFNTDQYRKYVVALRTIVREDKVFSDPGRYQMRKAMLTILTMNGYDRLMSLYRFYDQRTLAAHSDLGIFDYRTGTYQDALLNLSFATITILSVVIRHVEQDDPSYQFSTMEDLLARAQGSPTIAGYIDETGLYRDLYYVAAALVPDGDLERARSIWRLVVDYAPERSAWRERSALQERKPFVEPLLDIEE